MTPAARLSAAIELIDTIEKDRVPAAKALKEWGTAHRFAGSGDRAAIAFTCPNHNKASGKLHHNLFQTCSGKAVVAEAYNEVRPYAKLEPVCQS